MRQRAAFAQVAVLTMPVDADVRAPGGAVTQALCGAPEHPPPCPLAPHHTSTRREGDRVHVRVLFATEPSREPQARARIVSALAAGLYRHPDGATPTRWDLVETERGIVTEEEAGHAGRLVREPLPRDADLDGPEGKW